MDIPDPQSDAVAEDLSYNDMESISEFIFEYCLGWENFVPEHDEDDPEDHGGFAKKIEIAFVLKPILLKVLPKNYIAKTQYFFNYAKETPEVPYIPGAPKPPQA